MKKLLIVLPILFLFMASNVSAHPGRTASDGCHYCRTNCAKWGEVEGARHCHNGGSVQVTTPRPVIATAKPSTPRPTIAPTITPSETPTNTPEVLSISTEASQPTATPEVKVQGATTSNPVGGLIGLSAFLFLGYKGLKLLARKTTPSDVV